MHSAPYFTALGLFTIYLATQVIRLRGKHKVSLGHGGVPELEKATRAFGNFIEYTPLALLLLAVLEIVMAPTWYIHLAGVSLLSGRLLHAFAIPNSNLKIRVAGMMLTFLSIALSSIGATLFTMVSFG